MLKTGDILLYKENDFFAWAVKLVTRSKYNHVEVYLGDGKSVEIRPFRKIRIKNIRQKDLKKIDVYESTYPGRRVVIRDWAWNFLDLNKKYGLLNVFFFLFPDFLVKTTYFETDNTLICSEYTCKVLEYSGLKKHEYFHIPNSAIPPGKIPEYFQIKRVEGI